MRGALTFVLLLLVACAAGGEEAFELVVTGSYTAGCTVVPITDGPTARWLEPDRGEGDPSFGILAGYRGRVFAIAHDPRRTARVLATGLGEAVFTFPSSFTDIHALGVAPNGRFFVATAAGLTVVSAAGAIEAEWPLSPMFTEEMALAIAPDSCAMYFAGRYQNEVRRFDACTGQTLPAFPVAEPWITDLDTLSNGHVLVSGERGVTEYDAGGQLIRRIVEQNGDVALHVAVTANEAAIWVARMPLCDFDGSFLKLSLTDGELLDGRQYVSMNDIIGMAAGAADVAPIPSASPIALLILAATLALAALSVLRR
jgi:hypothetical protein